VQAHLRGHTYGTVVDDEPPLSTAWTFASGHSPDTTYLPLLQVDFDIAVDTLNRALPGADFPIQLPYDTSRRRKRARDRWREGVDLHR
jgi:hypothetical protein